MSGVIPLANTDTLKPHLDTALSVGKGIVSIVYQSDGIINNSPMLGSFTSLMIKPELQANNLLLLSDLAKLQTSLTTSSPGEGDPITTTSLTPSEITDLTTHLTNINDMIYLRRIHDEGFYANSINIMSDISSLRKYTEGGETMKYLVDTVGIGTPKLKNYISVAETNTNTGQPWVNKRSTIPKILSIRFYKEKGKSKRTVEIRYEGIMNYATTKFIGFWDKDLSMASFGVGEKIFEISLTESYGTVTSDFLIADSDTKKDADGKDTKEFIVDYSVQPMICYGTKIGDSWLDYPLLSEQVTEKETPWPVVIPGTVNPPGVDGGAPVPSSIASEPRILSAKIYRPVDKSYPAIEVRYEGMIPSTSNLYDGVIRVSVLYNNSFVAVNSQRIDFKYGISTFYFDAPVTPSDYDDGNSMRVVFYNGATITELSIVKETTAVITSNPIPWENTGTGGGVTPPGGVKPPVTPKYPSGYVPGKGTEVWNMTVADASLTGKRRVKIRTRRFVPASGTALSEFSNVIEVELNTNEINMQILPYAYGGMKQNDLLIIKFTTNSLDPEFMPSLVVGEYASQRQHRIYSLSTVPGSFKVSDEPSASNETSSMACHGNVVYPSPMFFIGSPSKEWWAYMYPILKKNTTYYLNVKNDVRVAPPGFEEAYSKADMFIEGSRWKEDTGKLGWSENLLPGGSSVVNPDNTTSVITSDVSHMASNLAGLSASDQGTSSSAIMTSTVVVAGSPGYSGTAEIVSIWAISGDSTNVSVTYKVSPNERFVLSSGGNSVEISQSVTGVTTGSVTITPGSSGLYWSFKITNINTKVDLVTLQLFQTPELLDNNVPLFSTIGERIPSPTMTISKITAIQGYTDRVLVQCDFTNKNLDPFTSYFVWCNGTAIKTLVAGLGNTTALKGKYMDPDPVTVEVLVSSSPGTSPISLPWNFEFVYGSGAQITGSTGATVSSIGVDPLGTIGQQLYP